MNFTIVHVHNNQPAITSNCQHEVYHGFLVMLSLAAVSMKLAIFLSASISGLVKGLTGSW